MLPTRGTRYVSRSPLTESPLAPPSVWLLPERGSAPSSCCLGPHEGEGVARLEGARELLPLSQLRGWAELCELPYCFESTVSNSGLEHASAVWKSCRPDWLLAAAAWCSDQSSPAVLSPWVLGVPPQYDSNLNADSPSAGGDVGEQGVVGWDLGLACTIWIPPIGIIRQGTLACCECMGRWLKMWSAVGWE